MNNVNYSYNPKRAFIEGFVYRFATIGGTALLLRIISNDERYKEFFVYLMVLGTLQLVYRIFKTFIDVEKKYEDCAEVRAAIHSLIRTEKAKCVFGTEHEGVFQLSYYKYGAILFIKIRTVDNTIHFVAPIMSCEKLESIQRKIRKNAI